MKKNAIGDNVDSRKSDFESIFDASSFLEEQVSKRRWVRKVVVLGDAVFPFSGSTVKKKR